MPAVLRRSRPALPRYAVAWFPRFERMDDIEAFRRRHDPMATLIAAHVTLVFPFATSLTRLQIETHVKRVVSRWPPIPASFRAVRLHGNEFLFLMAGQGAPAIAALHDRLYSRSLLPYLRRDLPYEPHITIARNDALPALEAAHAEARAAFGHDRRDVLREVTLLAVERDGRIERLGTIALATA